MPKELVEAVVDKFGDALPWRELDVAEDAENAGMWSQVDTGCRLGHRGPSAGNSRCSVPGRYDSASQNNFEAMRCPAVERRVTLTYREARRWPFSR
jgi:ABC-type antimicrobial peptide transport system ATPase subunit